MVAIVFVKNLIPTICKSCHGLASTAERNGRPRHTVFTIHPLPTAGDFRFRILRKSTDIFIDSNLRIATLDCGRGTSQRIHYRNCGIRCDSGWYWNLHRVWEEISTAYSGCIYPAGKQYPGNISFIAARCRGCTHSISKKDSQSSSEVPLQHLPKAQQSSARCRNSPMLLESC